MTESSRETAKPEITHVCKDPMCNQVHMVHGHPTAEPALSAEQVESMFDANDAPSPKYVEHIRFEGRDCVVLSPEGYEYLYNMALSSLTARDEVEKMRRRVEMYRDKARGNHEAYLKLYADFVGIEGASHG